MSRQFYIFVLEIYVSLYLNFKTINEVSKNTIIILEELMCIRSGIMNLVNKLKGLITHKDVIYSSEIWDCQLAENFFRKII